MEIDLHRLAQQSHRPTQYLKVVRSQVVVHIRLGRRLLDEEQSVLALRVAVAVATYSSRLLAYPLSYLDYCLHQFLFAW